MAKFLKEMEMSIVDSSQSSSDSTKSTSGIYSTKENIPCPIFNEIPHFQTKPYNQFQNNISKNVTLVWQDLSVYVPIKKPGLFSKGERHRSFKRVLNNISGVCRPGELLAIMGSSGSGKTTLMHLLAYRSPGYVAIDGNVKANGMPISNFMKYMSGFVYQEDFFINTLTVLEHLNFMAIMKLDRRLSSWERKRRIEELLLELGLKKCEKTRIKELSGGELKRLSFASEVLTDPPLLFCDEPTTGLDAFSAQKLVGMMKNLAARGKTIICTIHQPSSQVFSMFDRLCLLAEGRMAYMGSSEGALAFMESLNFVCPKHFNPADFYIRCLAVYPGKEKESLRTIKDICDTFTISEHGKELEENVQREYDLFNISCRTSSLHESFADQCMSTYKAKKPSWFTQTYWLSKRSLKNSYRNPDIHFARTIQKIAIGLLIGFCYFGINSSNQKGIQDTEGAIFILITECTFPSMYSTLHVFPLELPLFLRENKNGLYPVGAYYISKIVEALPGFIIEPFIFGTIAYFLIGLRPVIEAYLLTLFMVILTSNTAAACGMFFSSAFDSVNLAITFLIPFDYILMITGGFFINLGTMPVYASWMKFLSWFMYSNEALSIIQWKGIQNISCETNQPDFPCIRTGQEVVESKYFSNDHLPYDFIFIFILYSVFHIMAYFALVIKSHRK